VVCVCVHTHSCTCVVIGCCCRMESMGIRKQPQEAASGAARQLPASCTGKVHVAFICCKQQPLLAELVVKLNS